METLLTFGVGVDTSSAEAGLASLGGSAEGVAAGLEDRLASASDGMKDLGKQSSQASRGIQGLASVVSLVDPRLGQVIRSVGTLTRGLSVLRLGMGPAALAVGGVVLALNEYQKEQERARIATENLSRASEAQRLSQQGLQRSYEDLNAQLDETARAELEILNLRRQSFAESLPGLQDVIKGATAARLEVSRLEAQYRDLTAAGAEIADEQILPQLNDAINELKRYEGLEREIIANLKAQTENRIETLKVQRDQEEAAKRKQEATRDQTKQLQEAARLEQQRLRAEKERADIIADLASIQRDASMATMTEEERINVLLAERLARLEEIEQASMGALDTTAAEAALRAQAEQQLGELEQQRHDQKMAQVEQERAAQERLAAQQRQAAQEQIRIATDIAGTSSQLIAMGFKDKQAAMVAEGTSAAILAGINTIASNPTPLGIAQAGLNVALAMAQVAKMRSVQPSFHRGGFGDEYSATMRRGEAVLSPQGRQMMGDDAIRRANRGQAPQEGGGVIEVRQFYRHRPFDEFARDNLERGGPVTSAINGSRQGRSYHRSNRNGA